MNASDYKISVQRIEVDNEILFEATAAEFPDVAIYEEDPSEAYSIAVETIEGLLEMSLEMGHPLPQPSKREEEDYSGKMTFRPGKRLHCEIAAAAAADGLSQNQWLCNVVAQSIGVGVAQAQLQKVAAYVFNTFHTSTFEKWNTFDYPKQTRSQSSFGSKSLLAETGTGVYRDDFRAVLGLWEADLMGTGAATELGPKDVTISQILHTQSGN